MIKKSISYKHFLLFAIIVLFVLALTEFVLAFTTNKKNSETYVYTQNNFKVAPLNSLYANFTEFHNCPSENRTEDSFYEFKIVNYLDKNFVDWKAEIKLKSPVKLKGCWNANAVLKDNIISITPDKNITTELKKSSLYIFELYLNSDCPVEFESVSITGHLLAKLWQNPLHIAIVIISSIIIVAIIICTIMYNYMNREINVLNLLKERSNTIIEQTMKTFVNFIDAKDEYTKGHSTRVAEYSKLIAKRMGYNEQFQQDMYYMGLMHDIGKITVPDSILNKTAHLTADEWAVIQMHTENGARLLRNFTVIPEIKDAVLYHHERYDGKGYLAQLKGEEIPLCARIICVADSYDAMSTTRCYRLKYSKARIIKEFERCSGKQFDPAVTRVMIELLSDGTI